MTREEAVKIFAKQAFNKKVHQGILDLFLNDADNQEVKFRIIQNGFDFDPELLNLLFPNFGEYKRTDIAAEIYTLLEQHRIKHN